MPQAPFTQTSSLPSLEFNPSARRKSPSVQFEGRVALAAHKQNRKEILSMKLGDFQPMNR